jgi:predicted DCC family thiol-disulfide oxidoreductase YuxK
MSNELEVFYDGSCPLCAREIGFYRRRVGADAISWVDVSKMTVAELAPGLSKTRALARFHVLTPTGDVLSGAEAFARIWVSLPGFRWLGLTYRFRPMAWLLETSYNGFLVVRPLMQRLARRAAAEQDPS